MIQTYRVRIGGLLRCCLLSLDEAMEQAEGDSPSEGDILKCHYCKSPDGGMIFTKDAWEWNHPKKDESK